MTLVAGDHEMIDIAFADSVGSVNGANAFRRVSGTAEADHQSCCFRVQVDIGGFYDIGGCNGSCTESSECVDKGEQRVADIFTGAGSSKDDVEVLLGQKRIHEFFDLFLVVFDLF